MTRARPSRFLLVVLTALSMGVLTACGDKHPQAAQGSNPADLQRLIHDEAGQWGDKVVESPKMVAAAGFNRDEYEHLVTFLTYLSGIKQVPTTVVTVPGTEELTDWLPPPSVEAFTSDAEERLGSHWDSLLLFPVSEAATGGPDPSKTMRAEWRLQQGVEVSGVRALRVLLRTFKATESRDSATSVVVARTFQITYFANDDQVPVLAWAVRTYGVDTCALLADHGVRAAPPSEQARAVSRLRNDLRQAPPILEVGRSHDADTPSCGTA